MTHIVAELSYLDNVLSGGVENIESLEMLTEELAACAFPGSQYEWNDSTLSAQTKRFNTTISLTAAVNSRIVHLNVSWLGRGGIDHESTKKYLPNALESFVSLIGGAGWTVLGKFNDKQQLRLEAEIDANTLRNSFDKSVQAITEGIEKLDFS